MSKLEKLKLKIKQKKEEKQKMQPKPAGEAGSSAEGANQPGKLILGESLKRKVENIDTKRPVETKHVKQVTRVNQDVYSEKFDKLRAGAHTNRKSQVKSEVGQTGAFESESGKLPRDDEEQAPSEDEGDFLVLKKQKLGAEDQESRDGSQNAPAKPKLVVSKRQLKKIKMDGLFDGQNKVFFDDEGKQLSHQAQIFSFNSVCSLISSESS